MLVSDTIVSVALFLLYNSQLNPGLGLGQCFLLNILCTILNMYNTKYVEHDWYESVLVYTKFTL